MAGEVGGGGGGGEQGMLMGWGWGHGIVMNDHARELAGAMHVPPRSHLQVIMRHGKVPLKLAIANELRDRTDSSPNRLGARPQPSQDANWLFRHIGSDVEAYVSMLACLCREWGKMERNQTPV